MRSAPRNLRLHIGFLGRRNVGKSSLLNALAGQEVAIVSPTPGTTTDPVEKPMELLPLGPVVLVDTAGVDDEGALGEMRISRTRRVIERVDLAVLVVDGELREFEENLIDELRARGVTTLVCFNKADEIRPEQRALNDLSVRGIPYVVASAKTGDGVEELRQALLRAAPEDHFEARRIVGDLVGAGDLVVLVVPIDDEAPKGRLILPQVQTLRDLLDSDAAAVVTKESGLSRVLSVLERPPKLIVTDSQAFEHVMSTAPESVPVTSFSILFARLQGDLGEMVKGARSIEHLRDGDKVLVAEGCSHHPIGEDIGRVKIPRWLRKYSGAELFFETVAGRDFPEDLSPYKLVIHCGNCMGNRREMLSRILRCSQANVPITNYGITLALSLGILDRALRPFSPSH